MDIEKAIDKLVKEGSSSRRTEITNIRDAASRVAAKPDANTADSQLIYRMFGSLSKEQLQGLVMGLNFMLSNLNEASTTASGRTPVLFVTAKQLIHNALLATNKESGEEIYSKVFLHKILFATSIEKIALMLGDTGMDDNDAWKFIVDCIVK